MFERFVVGDAVTYQDGIIGTKIRGHITKVMPSDRGSGIYHFRDLAENFERSVAGNTLTRNIASPDGVASHFIDTIK